MTAWTTPQTFAVSDVLTAANMNIIRDNFLHLNEDVEGTLEAVGYATVATGQSTIDTSFGDLTTAGPSVTVTVRSSGRLLVLWASRISVATAGNIAYVDYVLSGANARTASINTATYNETTTQDRFAGMHLATGLVAGSTTVKLVYRGSSGVSATFSDRAVFAFPL